MEKKTHSQELRYIKIAEHNVSEKQKKNEIDKKEKIGALYAYQVWL